MRNLKRALSLTLASVMLLGMMVVGAGAASFPDVDENDNVEAIEVLNAVEVILGYDNGDFGPDDLVTRAQMAVIMAKLLNLDYQYYEAACPFTDVPEWARGYVGACYAKGITSGYSATTYGSNDGITPVQAASMMMRALGYFQYAEDYKAGFEVATVSQGTDIGIFNGVGSSATASMTRNQVARMALNALRSNIVTFTGTPGIEVNGVVVGYRPEYTPRTSPEAKYNAITSLVSDIANTNQYYIQLGEQLYDGDLRLDDNAIDEYGRPARHWEFEGKGIGTYAKKELLRKDYNLAVTGVDMYNLLGSSVVTDDDYTLDVYVDGAEYVAPNDNAYANFTKTNFTRNNKADMAYTGRGVQTEVYVNNSTKEITVAIINTYLAKAVADYSTTTEKVTVRVYDPYLGMANKDLDLKDFPEIEGMKKDDLILVNWADDTSITRNNEKVITKIMTPEALIDSTVTKFSTNGKVTKLTTNGTQYESARMLEYDADVLYDYDESLLTDKTYDIYLDQFGNAIGVALHSGTDNYVFITGYDLSDSNYAVTRGSANAIFLDGTMKVIDVNVKDTNAAIKTYNDKPANVNDYDKWDSSHGGAAYYTQINTWYKYTETNGVYTLSPVDANRQFATAAGSITIDNKNIRQAGTNIKVDGATLNLNGWADDKSVFVTVDVDEDLAIKGQPNVIDEVTGCYTGIDNVSITTDPALTAPAAYFLMDSKNYFIGAVVIGDNNGANNNYAYIFGGAKSERFEAESSTRSTTGTYYWEIDAVIDGEWKENVEIKTKYKAVIDIIKAKIDAANAGDNAGEKWASGYLFRLSYDSDGYITSAKPYDELANTTYIFANSQAATGWAAPTDKESVRYMNVGTVAYGNSGYDSQRLISRNERTLYNMAYSTDNGLRTASDCKFVVRQVEYGKNVTRVYSSLDAALAGITEVDYTTNGDTSIDFNGTVAAVLDGNAQAKWIVFDNNTPLNADQNKPSTPVGNYTSWVEGNTVHVVLVDTNASIAAIRSEAAKALVAAGYSNPQTAMLSGAVSNTGVAASVPNGLIMCGNEWFAVDYINYWTLKIDGSIKEYVEHGTNAETTWKDVYDTFNTRTGTGVVKKISGHAANDVYVAYTTISSMSSTAVASSETIAPMTIDSGYIQLTPVSGTVNTTDSWAVNANDYESVNSGAVNAVKVGTVVRVTYTTGTTGVAADQLITMTFTGAGSVGSGAVLMEDAKFDTAGNKAEFTINTRGATADITALDLALSAAPTPVTIALKAPAVDVSGWASGSGTGIAIQNVKVTPDGASVAANTKVTVSFDVVLTGTPSAAAKIDVKDGSAAITGLTITSDSIGANLPGGVSETSGTISVTAVDYGTKTVHIEYSFTTASGTDVDEINVVVADP